MKIFNFKKIFPFKRRAGTSRSMKLATKLIISFSFLVLIIAATGGAGIFFIKKIQVLSDSVSPLVNVAIAIGEKTNKAHIALAELSGLERDEQIVEQKNALSEIKSGFEENLEQLSAVIKEFDFDVDTGKVEELKGEFFRLSDEALAAQQQGLKKAAETRKSLEAFEQQKDAVEEVIDQIGSRNEAELSKIEERGTTLELSGRATGQDHSGLQAEMFGESYPLVLGASKLQGYLVRLQEVTKSYLAETDKEKLAGIQEEFEKAAKSIDNRIKRLGARAASIVNQNAIDKLTKSTGHLKGLAVSESGLFAIHRQKLDADVHLARTQESLKAVSADFEKTIEKIYETADRIKKETRLTAESEVVQARKNIAVVTVLGILAGILFLLISTRIIRPIRSVVAMIKDIAEGEGDLTKRMKIERSDEVGELANWFNSFIQKLQAIVKDIAANTETLASFSSELSAVSQQMSSGAEGASAKTNAVASATEEVNGKITAIASTMQQASANIGMVASSAEEMAASINEIAKNSEKASTISGSAVSQAKNAALRVGELGAAARQISKVTETITEISEQTNLLALNATIEAARAGDAGKGFAVVANEIKELARQTAEATEEIRKQIEGIQKSISGAIADIEQVPRVINEVNEIVSGIAAAVEEQSATTREIAGNVAQASQGIQEVTENVAQSSTVTAGISKEIAEVSHANGEMANSSAQVNLSAEELSKIMGNLKSMVGRFKF
ncbi:MAG: HAMP domain-containing protein [Desulfobacteraceae bacterium]|nr:MAG: HAMP domain-containing protein [Desulfobacteraceae bacterium]